MAAYHQNGGFINGNGLYRPPSSEFDSVDKKTDIGPWNPEKWQENGISSKLSPSDQGIVRTATPSANSTESNPSSVRHSLGPEDESTEDPESKSSRTVTPEEKSQQSEIKTEADEASSLLLNFSSRPEVTERSVTPTLDKNRLIAMQIEEKIMRERLAPEPANSLSAATAESIENVVNTVATADFEIDYSPQPNLPPKTQSPANPTRSRAFFRAPGLGPAEPVQGNGKVFICSICSFSCPSKFHYNSHMNTHGDHQCSMCDYTARTEGRMRKHMRDSHTREEQIAAGLEVPPEPANNSPQKTVTSMASEISSTMASIMEVANRAVTDATENGSSGFPSALDSIRALTEGGQNGLANLFQLSASKSENEAPESAGPSAVRDPPRRSSGGKPKKYTCKQCPHVSHSKEDSWIHMKSHIPIEKQLCCPQCEFVTEYKHHLEYHTRNHFSMKPFKCIKCNYACVNKSMLNSHMKSHSNQYQFQCMDCNYQSKYCHSLKMHLRKYNHRRKPGITIDDAEEALLNDPSLEDPGSVASSYTETQNGNTQSQTTPVTSAAPITSFGSALLQPIASTSSMQYANLLRAKQEQMNEILRSTQMLNCTVCDFSCATVDQMVQHNMVHLQQNQVLPQPSNFNAIFQYLSNMPALVNPQVQASGTATVNVGNPLPGLGFNPQELLLQVQKQQEEEKSIKMEVDRAPTPGETSEDSPSSGERSSTSPMDGNRDISSTGSANSGSSRKRKNKTGKLEEISQRLQFKNSPEHSTEDGPQLAQPIPISAFRQPFLVSLFFTTKNIAHME